MTDKEMDALARIEDRAEKTGRLIERLIAIVIATSISIASAVSIIGGMF